MFVICNLICLNQILKNMSQKSVSCVLPLGFKACGISANIKKSGKKDLALFYSKAPCVASAAITINQVKAAPLEVSRRHLRASKVFRAVLVNSGNANCMTGIQGIRDAEDSAKFVADKLAIRKEEVLVSSTGIIGRRLPIQKIKDAAGQLAESLSPRGFSSAAEAILTTDTFPKKVSKKFRIGNSVVTISGVTKGAGMVAPSMKMATMLGFIFTDALITKKTLDEALKNALETSFNAITIDGCMSTNDTVVVLANGAAENKAITGNGKAAEDFAKNLKYVCVELAKMIVADAEGATKFIEIKVRGANSADEAKRLAFSVANSNLFKCAMFGCDPNWGRIAAALGSIPSGLSWQKLDIFLNKQAVFRSGKPVEVKNNKFLRGRDIDVDIVLNQGKGSACVYTSDLSYEYVKINAEYN